MNAPLSFASRVSVPADVLVNVVGEESVLLNLKTERYYGLDGVGTRMWSVLTTSPSVQAAFEKLMEEYEVEAGRLREDLQALIAQLSEQGLLEIHNE
jgi:hypothetical protein